MRIAFFTEMGFAGKIPRNHPNMRTEFAWIHALDAIHIGFNFIPNMSSQDQFDLGIILTPKNAPQIVDIPNLRKNCKKIAIIQEGPNWFYQDYDIQSQFKYINNLHEADIILCHNESDLRYYKGILNNSKPIWVMPTLIIEPEPILYMRTGEKIIQGGNFCSWYGGVDSYIVARNAGFEKIDIPSMGRKKPQEEFIEDIEHLPYMEWNTWIHKLGEYKYGIHLMRTHAAGTFALNCAYLGIPCIGYKGLDTQEKCHPTLTVELGDLYEATHLLTRLRENPGFYKRCSDEAIENYKNYYHEDIFNSCFKKQLESYIYGK